jgi:hypothetical protein
VVLSTFSSFLLSPTCVQEAQRGLKTISRRHLNTPTKNERFEIAFEIISNFSSHGFGDDKNPKLRPHSTTLGKNNRCKFKSACRVEMCSIDLGEEVKRKRESYKTTVASCARIFRFVFFSNFSFESFSLFDDVVPCHIENLIRKLSERFFRFNLETDIL